MVSSSNWVQLVSGASGNLVAFFYSALDMSLKGSTYVHLATMLDGAWSRCQNQHHQLMHAHVM